MVFVSGPYSHPDNSIKQTRVNLIANACLNFMEKGQVAISPLTFGLSLIEKTGKQLPDDYVFWGKFCEEFVRACHTIYILDIDGWQESSGVRGEIEEAKKNNIPVYLINPETLDYIKQL